MSHICVSELTIIGSDNGLSPYRRQAIIWTNAGILLIGPFGTQFSEILIEIHKFSFQKMHLKMSSGKCRPFLPQCVKEDSDQFTLHGRYYDWWPGSLRCRIIEARGLFYFSGIREWIYNYIHMKQWDLITYPFPKYQQRWRQGKDEKLHPNEMMDVIIYPCPNFGILR